MEGEDRRETPFLHLDAGSRREHLFALAIIFLAVIALRWRAVTGLGTYYLGGSHADAGLYLWLFRYHLENTFCFGSCPPSSALSPSFFQTNAFFPYPLSLAWSDNFLFPALLAKPLHLLGVPADRLYSPVLLLAHGGLGYTTFRLTRKITRDFLSALSAGLVVLTLGYLTHSLGHPQLQFALCFPLALEILLGSFEKPLRSGFSFGLLVLATFLTTVYFAIFLLLFPPLFFFFLFLMKREKMEWQRLPFFLLGNLPGALLLLPFAAPYRAVREVFGERALAEMHAFRAEGVSLFSAPPLSLLYGETHLYSHAEAHFFLGGILFIAGGFSFWHCFGVKTLRSLAVGMLLSCGTVVVFSSSPIVRSIFGEPLLPTIRQYVVPFSLYGTLVLYSVLCYRLGRCEQHLGASFVTTRNLLAILFGIGLTFFVIALGPTGESEELQLSPFSLLYTLVPGFNALRAIARAALPALLLFPIFFGFSIFSLRKRYQLPVVAVPLLILGVLLENTLTNYALEPRDGAPLVLQTLEEKRQSHEVAIFLPMTDEIRENNTVKSWKNFAHRNVDVMNWAVDHQLLIVNGYSGQRTKIMKELPGRTHDFPSRESLDALARIGNVRYIVFESKHVPSFDPIAFQAAYKYWEKDLTLIEKDGEGYYLFRFLGETSLTPRHDLRIATHLHGSPRSTRITCTLSVKLPYEQGDVEKTIAIREEDHVDAQIAEKRFKPDGTWQELSFELPQPSLPTLPFRVRLIGDSLRSILIRGLHCQ
ncbi:hypothetical protein MRY87_02295 [bacterium]|nr:hypothetical protein [bacterium]